MSDKPEVKYQFVYERFSDEAARVMNQAGVRARMAPLAEGDITNACWDGMVAPDGRFYFPLSSENGECGQTKLAYFDYDQDKVIECFDAPLCTPCPRLYCRRRCWQDLYRPSFLWPSCQ